MSSLPFHVHIGIPIGAPVQVHTAGIIVREITISKSTLITSISTQVRSPEGSPRTQKLAFAPPSSMCIYSCIPPWPPHLLYFWSLLLPAVVKIKIRQLIPKYFRFDKAGKGKFPGTETSARLGLASFTFLPFPAALSLPPPFFLLHQLCLFPLNNNLKYSAYFLVVRFQSRQR